MEHLFRSDVPDLEAVPASGGEEFAIVRQRQAINRAALDLELADLLLRLEIPDADRAVEPGGDELLTVRHESEATNPARRVARQRGQCLAGRHVEQIDQVPLAGLVSRTSNGLAIGRKPHGAGERRRPLALVEHFRVGDVPDTDHLVPPARDEEFAVRRVVYRGDAPCVGADCPRGRRFGACEGPRNQHDQETQTGHPGLDERAHGNSSRVLRDWIVR